MKIGTSYFIISYCLYCAHHWFQVPEVEDVAVQVKRWEEDNQNDLRKLAALISKILEMVKGCGGNAVVKYDDKGDKLVV